MKGKGEEKGEEDVDVCSVLISLASMLVICFF